MIMGSRSRAPLAACSAAMRPLHDRALDRGRQPRVRPVAGEIETRRIGVRAAGRGGAAGASENVARCSRTTTDRTSRRVASLGQRLRDLLRARGRVSSALSSRASASAPLATTDRWPALVAEDRALVEHPVHRTADQADERARASTGPSNQRLTVTIGELAIARGVRRRRSRAPRARRLPRSGANACHGTALTTTAASRSSSPGLDTPRSRRARRARRAPATSISTAPPRASMNARAGSRVQLVERHARQADRRVLDARTEQLAEHAHERRGRGDVRRLIERGDRQRMPQPLAEPRRLTVRREPRRRPSASAARRAATAAAPSRRTSRSSGASRSALSRSRQRQRAPSQHAGDQVPRRRPGADTSASNRRPSRPPSSATVVGCSGARSRGADAFEKRVRLAVAAEQHVLAVVDALAGLAIGERRRAAAQPRRLLDDDDAQARVGQPHGGAEAGDSRRR